MIESNQLQSAGYRYNRYSFSHPTACSACNYYGCFYTCLHTVVAYGLIFFIFSDYLCTCANSTIVYTLAVFPASRARYPRQPYLEANWTITIMHVNDVIVPDCFTTPLVVAQALA